MSNIHELTLEQALLKDLLQSIKDGESRKVHFLATGSFESIEQAREIVGYIRACRDFEIEFKRIVGKYFPTS